MPDVAVKIGYAIDMYDQHDNKGQLPIISIERLTVDHNTLLRAMGQNFSSWS
jgi:hypothetical protein